MFARLVFAKTLDNGETKFLNRLSDTIQYLHKEKNVGYKPKTVHSVRERTVFGLDQLFSNRMYSFVLISFTKTYLCNNKKAVQYTNTTFALAIYGTFKVTLKTCFEV